MFIEKSQNVMQSGSLLAEIDAQRELLGINENIYNRSTGLTIELSNIGPSQDTAAATGISEVMQPDVVASENSDKDPPPGQDITGMGPGRAIAFIDSAVQNYQSLMAGITSGTEVIVLDSTTNGVAQITAALAARANISSVHILGHGNAGSLQLGNSILDSHTLGEWAPRLQQWGASLSAGADILLYGCNVAAGTEGVAFVNQLSQLTGADIAASNDLTGSSALGGDWDLEVHTGNIEASLAFEAGALAAMKSVLALIDNTTAQWTETTLFSSANYYLNNNFSAAGNPMFGAIDRGPHEYNASNGTLVNSYDNGADGAKSALEQGSYIFFAGDDGQGIRRIDNDWSSNLTGYQATVEKTESITTDGTNIYGNDDVNRDRIIKWSVTNNASSFTLNEVWARDVGSGGRFRGISYFDHSAAAGDEYIYASDGGQAGFADRIWALDTTFGADVSVKSNGTDITVPGTEAVYQAIVHEVGSRKLLMAVTTNNLYVWDMASPTTTLSTTPTETYTLSASSGQLLDNGGGALSGQFYGAGARGNQLFLLHGSQVSAYQLSATAFSTEVTNTSDSGTGSLRQALIHAAANPGTDTITFTGATFTDATADTITLTSGELTYLGGAGNDLTIQAPGNSRLTISGNSSSRVFNINSAANVTLDGLTITGGNASGGGGSGGGILKQGAGQLTLLNSTLNANMASNNGGGIANESGSTSIVTNSTISGNSAGNNGGGIENGGTLTVNNSTITGNNATSVGGGINNTGTANVNNTIVAGNTAGIFAPDVLGTFVSNNSNLIGDTTTATGFSMSEDIVGSVDTVIDPSLADNGATTTQTHALVAGSPALDAGNNANVPGGITTDQRGTGFDRISNGTVDIGAYELQFIPLVINEIDYDQPSTDNAEFIELKNIGSSSINLDPFDVLIINGSGGSATIARTIDLPNVNLAAGDYYVISANAANVPNTDLDVSPDTNLIQNGNAAGNDPDAVALVQGSIVIDTVSYEGDTGAPYTEGTGVGLEDDGNVANRGISRVPDGTDTNNNNTDFTFQGITPGLANVLPDVAISSPAIPAASVLQGTTNHPLYQLDLAVSTTNAQLTGATFTTDGSYIATDIVPSSFELFYSADAIFDGGDTSLGTQPVVTSGNNLTFTGLSQTINSGTTGTLFLVADIATGATPGNTINIAAPALADITFFPTANKTGTPTAGGLQTFDAIPTFTSITRQTPATEVTNADTLVFRTTFSEDVQNLDGTDFTVTGTTASITSVSGSGSVYDLTISGGDLAGFNGTVGLDLAAGQNIADLAGNNLPAGEPATDQTYTVDNTAPSAPSTPDMTAATDTGSSNTDNVTSNTTPTFTGTAEANSTVTLSSDVNGNIGTATADGAGNWSITVSTLDEGAHDITATAEDVVGNVSSASGALAITIDTIAPTVTINQGGSQADPTAAGPIDFTVLFNEPVTDFITGDVTTGGTASGTLTGTVSETAPNDGTTYNVAVSGMTGNGTVTASLGAGVAMDLAGNANAASTSTDNTVTFNANSAPVLDLNGGASGINYSETFIRGGGEVAIVERANLTVTDDGANLTSATVTITNLQDGANEVLTVDTSGTSITGSYDTATGVLSLSGSDTVANYQQVLRTVKYNNTAVSPNTTARAIAFLVNDGSVNSTTATTTLNITSATPIDVGTVSGPTFAPIASISDNNPDNIYDVTLGGGTSRLVVELATPFGNTDVELYDSSGNLLASSTNAGTTSERIDQSSLTAGNYQVRVFQASAGVAVDYLLRMNAA